MTLYDELVKLFDKHRLIRSGKRSLAYACSCGLELDWSNRYDEHLAALACERAVACIDSVKPDGKCWEYVLNYERVIAALGEVKRG